MYKFFFKRLADFTFSLLALILSLPITLPITIILYFQNGGKPFFRQHRTGYRMKKFKVLKFKTMNDKKDSNGELLPDHERITPIGKWVRSSSLDELPQLFNVLINDMSLVGPRPFLSEYDTIYNEIQKKRFEVKPGITGLAQVKGRNALSWKNKFKYDVFYVQKQSFTMDLWILILTLKKVIISEGVNASSQVTAEKFNGKN